MSYPRLKGKIVLMCAARNIGAPSLTHVSSTGASAGFGEATARQFAAAGSHLVLGARRVEKLQELQASILKAHPEAKIFVGPLDVTSNDSVTAFVKSIPKDLAAIDILVNNAGLALGLVPLWEVELEDMNRMLDTNVKGLVQVTKAVLPGTFLFFGRPFSGVESFIPHLVLGMLERKRGHIINISSIAGFQSYKNGSIYAGSKFAVEGITECLRKELVATPLRVTSIQPGLAETEFSVVRFKGDPAKAKAPYQGIQPLVADDVADTILYVASRPEHVQIGDLSLTPANQASTEVIHRTT